MDRANQAAVENEYVTQGSGNDKYVIENGEKYRIPYDIVKEVVFSDIKKEELVSLERSARLQYRLLLNEAILRAKVSFVKRTITIVFNPKGSNTRNPEISLEEIIELLKKEGVHVDRSNMQIRDVDYVKEIWYPQFHPKEIREHPPYGYTLEEWKKIKPKYEKEVEKARKKKWEDFLKWRKKYEEQHPELKEQHAQA